MNVYLVRHTEPVLADEQWRFLGHSDPPLGPRGIEQAHELAERLSHVHFDAIYSSDLVRAMQTAEIIAAVFKRPGVEQNVAVHPDPRLREIDAGLWEGLTRDEAAKRYPYEHEAHERDLFQHPFPGGESFADVRTRALPAFFDAALAGGETTLIVAHKGVNRVLLCEFQGLPLERLFSLRQDYGCINLIRASGRPDGSLEIEEAQPDIRLT